MEQEKNKLYNEIENELYDDWRAEGELEKQNEVIDKYIQKKSTNNKEMDNKEMKQRIKDTLNEIKDKKYFAILVECDLYKLWDFYFENKEEQNKIIEKFIQERMDYHKTMDAREMKEYAIKLLNDMREKKNRNKLKEEPKR